MMALIAAVVFLTGGRSRTTSPGALPVSAPVAPAGAGFQPFHSVTTGPGQQPVPYAVGTDGATLSAIGVLDPWSAGPAATAGYHFVEVSVAVCAGQAAVDLRPGDFEVVSGSISFTGETTHSLPQPLPTRMLPAGSCVSGNLAFEVSAPVGQLVFTDHASTQPLDVTVGS
jgi:hypothetical protein